LKFSSLMMIFIKLVYSSRRKFQMALRGFCIWTLHILMFTFVLDLNFVLMKRMLDRERGTLQPSSIPLAYSWARTHLRAASPTFILGGYYF